MNANHGLLSGSVPAFQTLVELLRHRALEHPFRTAFTFLVDGEAEEISITYEQLDRRARVIGGALQELGMSGQRALLLYPPGLQFIEALFGCLYAGVVAVPSYAPRMNRSLTRLNAIVTDAQAGFAMTVSTTLSKIRRSYEQAPVLQNLRWIDTENLDKGLVARWEEPAIDDRTLAFLQYTSGSTSTPKGVMVSHGNLLANSEMIHVAFQSSQDTVYVCWLPLFHDMGLIGNVLQTVYVGALNVLMAPTSFAQRPVRWLQAISKHQGVISGGPNSAYELLIQKVTERERESLDLSTWKLAFNGAEPVRSSTLERFAKAFRPCGFRPEAMFPCYGLAEATVFASGGLLEAKPPVHEVDAVAIEQGQVRSSGTPSRLRTLVGCGRTWLDQIIIIVDPVTCLPCPSTQVGEIWISGRNVGSGYWKRPGETNETFGARLATGEPERFLRTGDLGFIQDAELFVTGRLKDLIILNGRNHYPQDIEATAEHSDPTIRPNSSAAFSIDVGGEERLVLVCEVVRGGGSGFDGRQLFSAIRHEVAKEHEVELYDALFIRASTLPRTSSGKVQRRACRDAFLSRSGLSVVGEGRQHSAASSRPMDVPADGPRSFSDIKNWLIRRVASYANIEPGEIDPRSPFDRYGLNSSKAVMLSGELQEWLGYRLNATIAYDFPTIERLARRLVSQGGPDPGAPTRVAAGANRSAVAVIGMSCRFPGADGTEAFWHLLREGIDAVTEVPKERWDIDAFFDSDPLVAGKMSTRWGGFLEGVEQFDASFFHISPREAIQMDPQQRLLLEVTWNALEYAGIPSDRLRGSETGVFIGISAHDYARAHVGDPSTIDLYFATGNALSIAANRISYLLDLRGPSMAVDTACSSSLVSVHLACQSIWNGECRMALAGGVNLILTPETTISFSKGRMMARDGRCKTFDAAADGYVRGEGCGVIVLKSLDDAISDGDNIVAVIRGSAVNQDGRSNGLTAPNGPAQEAVILKALETAGVSPALVGYIETHGTGTPLGDPIEVQALASVFAHERTWPCAIGSVKTNIGHLEAAAGIASLIKVALSLKHGQIPPNLHFKELNPHLNLEGTALVVPTVAMAWPSGDERRFACVSSFGFGGTNAHVVLEESPNRSLKEDQSPSAAASILPLSAGNMKALQELAESYRVYLSTSPAALKDICYSASVRHMHYDHRLTVSGYTCQSLAEQIDAYLNGDTRPGISRGSALAARNHKVVFVFPGQGSQWLGMGRQLLQTEPVFRRTIEECQKAMERYVEWRLVDELLGGPESSRIEDIDVIQPMLFAIGVGLAAIFMSKGIIPDAVVGHSLGEIAAAYVAGVLTLDDAAKIICERGKLLKRLSGRGAMAVVELSLSAAREAIKEMENKISVAVSNSKRSTVLSGNTDALRTAINRLEGENVFCRYIKVDVASHSPDMDELRGDLLNALKGLQPACGAVPIYSTVTGEMSEGSRFVAEYWVRNLREPVLFSMAVETLLRDGHDIFIEMSPHPMLAMAVEEAMSGGGKGGIALAALRRGLDEQIAVSGVIGDLYSYGYPVKWEEVCEKGKCVNLPPYPWQRERFWPGARGVGGSSQLGTRAPTDRNHPLLGEQIHLSVQTGDHFWETGFDTKTSEYLNEHRVKGMVILPVSVYVEMALEATSAAGAEESRVLEDIEFKNLLVLPEGRRQVVQAAIIAERPGTSRLEISSLDEAEGAQPTWTQHAIGRLLDGPEGAQPPSHPSIELIQASCGELVSALQLYEALSRQGVEYGEIFKVLHDIRRREGEAIARIRVSKAVELDAKNHMLHPVLLEAGFQSVAVAFGIGPDRMRTEDSFIPVHLERVRLYSRARSALWVHSLLRPSTRNDLIEADVWLLDEVGGVIAHAEGLRLQRVAGKLEQEVPEWFYETTWECKPLTAQPNGRVNQREGRYSLLLSDNSGVAEELKRLRQDAGEKCLMVRAGAEYTKAANGDYSISPDSSDQFFQLIKDVVADDRQIESVVHLWSLDVEQAEDTINRAIGRGLRLGTMSAIYVMQALLRVGMRDLPKLWLVTRGVHLLDGDTHQVSIAQSPLWGLGRTIGQEHPGLSCCRVDLVGLDAMEEAADLHDEMCSEDAEDEVAWRGRERYVGRLMKGSAIARTRPLEPTREVVGGVDSFSLEINGEFPQLHRDPAGCLPTNLQRSKHFATLDALELCETELRRVGAGQVEIAVEAAGLNFLDVLSATGARLDESGTEIELGCECAGRITAVGKGVEELHVGEGVIALAPRCFGSFAVAKASLVATKPNVLGFEEAATLPIAFLTAIYGLVEVARLGTGEKVLIHNATGGVGLAAIQIATQIGAEVFATAGSEEQRQYLRKMGIGHVMDSRAGVFGETIRKVTSGEGIDVVLNSLTGPAIEEGLKALAPYGRFVDLGKKAIYEPCHIEMELFKNNLSYRAVDLAKLALERAEYCGDLLRQIVAQVEAGTLKALPIERYAIGDSWEAFRRVAQRSHLGKIVLSVGGERVTARSRIERRIRPDGAYLITGGLSGIGLLTARWMVEQGARHVVLMGRKGPTAQAQEAIEEMTNAGAKVDLVSGDVGDEATVNRVVEEITSDNRRLRGVIHSAGVLADGTLLSMDPNKMNAMYRAKVTGSWNLAKATRTKELDFFVLYSSMASMIGSPGQGNYAAGNEFMNALAVELDRQGRAALSISWGPWSEIGFAARPESARLLMRGMVSIGPDDALRALDYLLNHWSPPRVGVMKFDFRQWSQFYPRTAKASRFQTLVVEEGAQAAVGGKGTEIRDKIVALASGLERRTAMESHLREQISRVLRLDQSRIEPETALGALGFDSLMALELRNRLEVSLDFVLPATLIWAYPSLALLTAHLVEKLGVLTEDGTCEQQLILDDERETYNALVAKVGEFSEDQAEAILLEKLSSLGVN